MQLSQLKLSGYSSASKLEEIFASYMVDIAYLSEVYEDYALVAPDEPEHTNLSIEADRKWLIEVIQSTMKQAGENSVRISLFPSAP